MKTFIQPFSRTTEKRNLLMKTNIYIIFSSGQDPNVQGWVYLQIL